jgi:hypothetical protein
MRFWFSGEIEADVGEAYRPVRREIEQTLNEILSDVDYGPGVSKWAFLSIILAASHSAFPEIRRYDPLTTVVEFRLWIDYRSFKDAGPTTQKQMFYARLLSSVDLATALGIPSFDLVRLKRDMVVIGRQKGWIP